LNQTEGFKLSQFDENFASIDGVEGNFCKEIGGMHSLRVANVVEGHFLWFMSPLSAFLR
jgi:hypothetical protein